MVAIQLVIGGLVDLEILSINEHLKNIFNKNVSLMDIFLIFTSNEFFIPIIYINFFNKFLTNLIFVLFSPNKSSVTKTCPSQNFDDPIPIVGILKIGNLLCC